MSASYCYICDEPYDADFVEHNPVTNECEEY